MNSSLKLEHKSYIIATIIFIVLLVQSLWLRSNSNQIDAAIDYAHNVLTPMTRATNQLKLDIVQVQQWISDISATRGLDGLNDGKEKATQHATNAQTQINKLKQLMPEYGTNLNAIEQHFKTYHQAGLKMADIYINEGPAGGNQFMPEFDIAAENLQQEVAKLISHIEKLENDTEKNIVNAAKNGVMVSNSTLISGLGIVALLVWFIRFLLLKPIIKLQKTFVKLNQGDASLDFRFKVHSDDEVGTILQSFNDFLAKLKTMASEVQIKSTNMHTSIEELYGVFASTKSSIEKQLTQVDTLSVAMNEMSATSADVAKSAEEISARIGEVQVELDGGYQLSVQTQTATTTVSEQIHESTEVINQLEERTNQINAIIDNIKGIAEQTNLLALNAAIEAARAGEQGRGFAVVADEVRSLASRTQESTVEINSIITSLQDTALSAVEKMRLCNSEVNDCVQYAEQNQSAMQSLKSIMDQMSAATFQTASAMEQNSLVIEENSSSLLSIKDASNESEKGLSQSYHAVDDLIKQAEDLKSISHTFGQ